ncbi:MAG: hypothetical protein A2927_00640 [Candidatus Komeilibacteria bacterium RIFCSPLOWO2_01_FULL_45_10]|uniref:YoaR-like putative peptidoglycan binding domain-containing protein n=1 Tax=Candidatus Komeilibacteria bacterium RIFCSPLOWO2_01_FULL_45_10 TaxID=1798550 RepID=A0A1G2BKI4_9BACT|nr:MAG: hypothetical protein A2927_00640 [Candidatus Komeilibacteria bacterium RIFCSPLOWO2_01_FULL_45_10]
MKWLLLGVTIFLIMATALALAALSYAHAYQYRFFPGVKINNEPLGNLSHAQAVEDWQNKVDDFIKTGLKYQFKNQEIAIATTLLAAEPDIAYELVSFNVPETADEAYLVGRKKGYRQNFLEQLSARFLGKNIPLKFNFKNEQFLLALKQNLDKFTVPKKEAWPQISQDLTVTIQAEATGTAFDYQKIIRESLRRIQNLSREPIALELVTSEPQIKKDQIPDFLINQLKDKVNQDSLTLTYQNQKWTVSNQDFKDWLIFVKEGKNLTLGLDASTTLAYLEKNIAPDIFKPTLEARFEIKNGRVTEFQSSQDGRDLDLEKSFEKIAAEFLKNNQTEIPLVVKETKAKITTASLNDLGINEIIGTGHSNFKGSPKNRRHNIAVGASALNGILIKPGETFSLLDALGEVDQAAGYLPELVIKGDKTIPEYGGGLCQIGTTVFRAALAAGLPIVERRNHSYRVVYYEPAGKDATIYSPSPDFKFTNDTGRQILIQTRIEGDDLYFDFWGTADGRLSEQTDSVVSNIKPAGETIYLETDELKPGEEKCIEKPHAGADAYFDYTVTYPDGAVKKQRFSSHYIPWPEKCLVGKQPTEQNATPTSTEEIVQ